MIPELLASVTYMLDESQKKLSQTNVKISHEKQGILSFAMSLQHCKDELNTQKDALKYIEILKEIRGHLKSSVWSSDLSSKLSENIKYLQVSVQRGGDIQNDKFFTETLDYLLTLFFGYFKKEFLYWHVLENPKWALETIHFFQELAQFYDTCHVHLSGGRHSKRASSIEKKNSHYWIFQEFWLPKMRSLMNDPNFSIIYDSDFLINLLQAWWPVVPECIRGILIEQYLLPKFTMFIESMSKLNFQRDDPALHAWLIPWFTSHILDDSGKYLSKLLPFIIKHYQEEYRHAMPSDPMMKEIIGLWQPLLSTFEFYQFLNSLITPKLTNLLLDLEFFESVPTGQMGPEATPGIDPLSVFFEWSLLYPSSQLISILEKSFFTKWLSFFYRLVTNHNSCSSSDTIIQVYNLWKCKIPPQFIKESAVLQNLFVTTLDIINGVLENPSLPLQHFLL